MLSCPHCGAPMESKDLYCTSCGMAVTDMGKAAIGEAFSSEVKHEEITKTRRMVRQFFACSLVLLLGSVLFKGCIAVPPDRKPETPMIKAVNDELDIEYPLEIYGLEDYYEPGLPPNP